ncbi:hypothetical protein EOD39_14402 [Acipenser ruthenus]|uniref:Uncharacterized protein n=1 Tax=Acipenser ruthenus TaxID=7906 RepID=A0A662YNU9_ACIRT|nr:hypothetical protein EOD39_14402 [Acipenser ruthenus]
MSKFQGTKQRVNTVCLFSEDDKGFIEEPKEPQKDGQETEQDRSSQLRILTKTTTSNGNYKDKLKGVD